MCGGHCIFGGEVVCGGCGGVSGGGVGYPILGGVGGVSRGGSRGGWGGEFGEFDI